MKACSKCGESKPPADFARNSRMGDGLNPACKVCRNRQNADYRAANSQKIAARKRETHAANPAAQAAWTQAWRASNRTAHRLQGHRRRVLLAGASGAPFSADDLARDWQVRGLSGCTYCPGPFESIDHIVPLNRGGKHEMSNLVPACTRCNSSKRDSMLTDWLPQHTERLAGES